MKVMLLVMDEQRVILDRLYDIVQQNCDECFIYRLSKQQQLNLGSFLASVDYQTFDRVVIFLPGQASGHATAGAQVHSRAGLSGTRCVPELHAGE